MLSVEQVWVVRTEDLVNLFESMGIATGIDLTRLVATAEFCEQTLGRKLYGRVTRSGLNPVLVDHGSSQASRPA